MTLDDDAQVLAQIEELITLADGLREAGRLAEAEEMLLTLHQLSPSPRIARGLGLIAAARGAWRQALSWLQATQADGATLNAAAVCHIQLGEPQEALRMADLALERGSVEAWNNRGAALAALGHLEAACDSYSQALTANPHDGVAWCNLAAALQGRGRGEEAIAAAERAIAIAPTLAQAHAVRANGLYSLGRNAKAIPSYDRALALNPDQARLRLNRALCHLELGNYAQGWLDHEARWEVPGSLGPGRSLAMPRWQGEDITGKTILLHCEQGMGDSIQFIRYARLVAERGATVVLESFQAIERLLATAAGVTQIITRRDALPPVDVHCPLMSLPLALGRPEPYAPKGPYLHAPDWAKDRWREALPDAPLRIGLCVSGNPSQASDRLRSIPLADLTAALPVGPAYVLLHKEVRASDRAALDARPDIAFLGDRIEDFADTAALIDAMDLVVSVDTGVSHLAGAMAKPVWILARSPPDWRYARHPTRTDWYPSARVYRQEEPGDWPGVLSRAWSDLAAVAAKGKARPGASDLDPYPLQS